MGLKQLIKPQFKFHQLLFKNSDESGVALFMVISAMTVLTVLATEFTYVAQVNARMAIDSVDQLKAHYLAKTGLKLSLIRLKAYKQLKSMGKKSGGDGGSSAGGMPEIPRAILDQVWNFPFIYPIPTSIPGLTESFKDEIKKFESESSLQGRFSATIESESNRLNLNSILSNFVPKPQPSPTNPPSGGATPSPTPSFDVEKSRELIKNSIVTLIENKMKTDTEFAEEYRSLNIDELFDNILGWADFSHKPKNASGLQKVPYKRAPFYSTSELHMIHPIDDGLYDLISPNFTAMPTSGINVNTLQEPLLRGLFSKITDEEVTEFFKFRDSTEEDNKFKKVEDFWDYLSKNTRSLGGSSAIDELKKDFIAKGLTFTVDEESFKITVVAEVNKASRILEVWVTLDSESSNGPGLKIIFMRES